MVVKLSLGDGLCISDIKVLLYKVSVDACLLAVVRHRNHQS